MDKKCKHCGKPLLFTERGLKAFCSPECRKAHRRGYMLDLIKKKRQILLTDKKNMTPDMDVSKMPQNNPLKSSTLKPENRGHGLDEDNFSGFGGKKWFEMAKRHCCNFEVRYHEGYCCDLFTLRRFEKKCSDCNLGMALNLKYI